MGKENNNQVVKKASVAQMSDEDRLLLVKHYDKDGNKLLSAEEIANIVSDYNDKRILDPEVVSVLNKYDTNKDGSLDTHEMIELVSHIKVGETNARYAAYTGAFARAFRYLAFTSDFGEALRPVAKVAVVNAS